MKGNDMDFKISNGNPPRPQEKDEGRQKQGRPSWLDQFDDTFWLNRKTERESLRLLVLNKIDEPAHDLEYIASVGKRHKDARVLPPEVINDNKERARRDHGKSTASVLQALETEASAMQAEKKRFEREQVKLLSAEEKTDAIDERLDEQGRKPMPVPAKFLTLAATIAAGACTFALANATAQFLITGTLRFHDAPVSAWIMGIVAAGSAIGGSYAFAEHIGKKYHHFPYFFHASAKTVGLLGWGVLIAGMSGIGLGTGNDTVMIDVANAGAETANKWMDAAITSGEFLAEWAGGVTFLHLAVETYRTYGPSKTLHTSANYAFIQEELKRINACIRRCDEALGDFEAMKKMVQDSKELFVLQADDQLKKAHENYRKN